VPLRERDTGTGLQVLLECERAPLVVEFNDDVDLPRPAVGGMRVVTSIVRGQTQHEVRRQARVVADRFGSTAEDVDESLLVRHTSPKRNSHAAAMLAKFRRSEI